MSLNTSAPLSRSSRFTALSACLLAALAWLSPAIASAATLEGRIKLQEKRSSKLSKEVRFAVVYFEPDAETDVEPSPEPLEIVMSRKAFLPRVLPVTVGTRVQFPNDDRILHNVFSLSKGNRFDLGLYRRGKVKDNVFETPGVVQIFCNVHHAMVAYVLVLDTPFMTQPAADGSFTLEGLPEGSGTLTIWHERAAPVVRKISLPRGELIDVEMPITKPRIPPHRNKFGKPYKRNRRGRAY
ncbi:MAG: hypothetical protein AAF725_12925 [Acidobacteriota bacterium]